MNADSHTTILPSASCRVLNVNDDPTVRHAISCILARAGLAVTEAEDAASALRAIEEQPPELVLVDVNLPGMGGYELCAQIRQNPRTAHLPVVFLSALSKDDASRARGLEHGADGYLTWPVNQEVLAATIKSVLRLRQTEARLRESEERFRSTFEQAAIGLGHLTLEGQWTWVNSRLCHILGCSQAELLEKTWRDAACPENLPALVDRRRALLAGEVESFAVEQRCRRPDGSLVWTGWTVSLVRQSGGEPRHFLVVVADISVRKWTDENLLRLRAGIEASSEAVAIADPDGHHAYHNQAFTTMFGYRVEELLELLDPVALYADPAAGLAVFAAIMDGQSWRGEVEMVARDGRRFPVELRADAIRDERSQVIGLIGIHTDITEQRTAQEALAQSEARFRTLFDLAPDGIYLNDLHGNFVDGNQAAEQIIGYPKAELIGKSFLTLNLLSQADLLRAAAALARHAQGEPTGPEEFVLNRKDGRQVPVEIRAFPITLGKQPLVLGIARDISERKRAEETLAHERTLLRTVVDHLPIGIYVKNTEGRKTFVNPVEVQNMGVRSEVEALGQTDLDLYPPEQALAFTADDQQVFLTGQPLINREEWVTQRDGARVFHVVSKVPLRDAVGRVTGLVGISMNLTAHKRAEEALRERERQLATLMSNLPGMAYRCGNGRDWTMEFVSDGAKILTGYAAADLIANRVVAYGNLIHPADREAVWSQVQASLERREPFVLNYRLRTATGEERWVWEQGQGVFDAQNQAVALEGFIMNVTERKRAEQERTAMEVQMRQQQKLESIGTLAGGVAHEINNPINGIMNYAQLIQDRLPAGSPLAEYTGEILHETQRVATIVRDLLQFSRAEKQSHSPARLADMIEGTLSLIRTVIRHDQITLNVSVPKDLPDLKCRSQQIQQVLMNLMTNARDALNERYPDHDPHKVLNLSAGRFEKEGRHWIRVTVEDHGTGITPAVRERMFDPFFTTKPRDRGTGLGLAISHSIVKEHHGELSVESEPGRFTRLHLDLPVDNGWKT